MSAREQTGAKLADLDPADRRRLAEQALHQDAAAKARRRQERIASLLPEREHLRGCPAALTGSGRLEAFAVRRPPKSARETGAVIEPAREVTVVRCIECGGDRVIDRPYRETVEGEEVER